MAILAGAVSEMSFDTDAAAYITAVETADTQELEPGVKNAINDFVIGCKADGIWSPIKASCIMAGARTLSGALIPLTGSAPTNVSNLFVAGDYLRKTGLKGDGVGKHLDTNRASNADPQNNLHCAVFLTNAGTTTTNRAHLSNRFVNNSNDLTDIIALADNRLIIRSRNPNSDTVSGGTNIFASPAGGSVNFMGCSRSQSSAYSLRFAGTSSTVSTGLAATSLTSGAQNFLIFARNQSPPSVFSDARICWYSIGEAVDLALLDSRVSTLMAALGSDATYSAIFPRRRRSRSGGGVL
jgi:hypothetical protein